MNKMRPIQGIITRKFLLRGTFFKIGAAMAIVPFLCLILAIPTVGQKTSGQISGSVVDQSGAAVPEANITVTQVGTGVQRTAATNADGGYTITDLAIGTYRMSATKTGFKEAITENIVVNVATITRQDLSLEIGSIDQQVTITADTVQVETQTAAIGEVVTGEQVRELPLNGRSFVQLTQLQPGVSAANNFDSKNKGLFSGVDFSVNGNSSQSNLFLSDGANNNDTGSNRTILLYPSIEAIAEFKMLRNSYGPEYGQAAGSVISIVTRGGSNEFHGSLFYFGRNDALNAAEFFANRGGTGKDKLRRSDFGFSLGGPILKDRLFFFYSQEWNKELRGATRTANVPTLAVRSGDFSENRLRGNGEQCDGAFNGVIPANQLSPGGRLLLQLYPEPNRASDSNCNNYGSSLTSKIDFREENVRIDYNLTSKNQIFGRYTQDKWENPAPILFGAGLWGDDAFPGVESSWAQPARQAAVKLTSTLSTTAVNEVQFSYSANRINVTTGFGADLNQQINEAIPGFYPESNKVNGVNRPHPVFWGGIQPYDGTGGSNLWTEAPFRNSLDIYSVRDDFSKVYGNHTFKFGGLFDKAAKNEDSSPQGESPQFGGQQASAILTRGNYFGFGESNRQAVANTRYTNLEFYLGDSWKVRPNITLELGARYSIFFEPYDKNDAISSFLPELYNSSRPASDPCNGLVVPKGTNPCANIAGASTPVEFSNRSLRENNFKNIAPRLGVAWDVFKNGKTAIRAGFGQFYLRERVGPVVGGLPTNSPFVRTAGGNRTLDRTIVNGTDVTFTDVTGSNGSPSRSFSPEAKTPYSLQFNVSVGQEIWNGAAVEIGYVGNRARNQLTSFDLNQVPTANRLAAAFAPNGAAVNALRPYGNYGSIYQFTREGKADYDSLQVLFRTRFTRNSQFQAAYTWSKSLADFGLNDSGNAPGQFAITDNNNPGLNFGPSDINRPHIFVANLIYNLPELKGSNPFVRSFLGGWEVATIVQLSSGTSFLPNLNQGGISVAGGTLQGSISGTGSGTANLRPNRVEGVPCTIDGNGDGTQFINPAAFTLIGARIGEVGNAGPGSCSGPPTKNVDLSFYKNFSPKILTSSFFGESARIQFRFELFNAFNTAQFRGGLPTIYYDGGVVCGNAVCSPTNNVITGLVNGGPNGNFGQATQTRGGREIQYALKLVF